MIEVKRGGNDRIETSPQSLQFVPWSLATNAALVADVLSQRHLDLLNIANARRHPRIAATADP